jgi:hypothetical protein
MNRGVSRFGWSISLALGIALVSASLALSCTSNSSANGGDGGSSSGEDSGGPSVVTGTTAAPWCEPSSITTANGSCTMTCGGTHCGSGGEACNLGGDACSATSAGDQYCCAYEHPVCCGNGQCGTTQAACSGGGGTGSSSGSDAGGTTGSCFVQNTGTCVQELLGPSDTAGFDTQCTQSNQGVLGTACPTASLIGCCGQLGQETCYYGFSQADVAAAQTAKSDCAALGETWTTTP